MSTSTVTGRTKNARSSNVQKPTYPKVEMHHAHLLVEDSDLYPRHKVDETHVTSLAEALRSGVSLPPIVADSRTKVVIDGWHRLRAYRRVYGDTVKVPVVFKSYPDRASMVREAVELNIVHGLRLQPVDQVRSAHLLKAAGLDTKQIAVVMRMTEARTEQILARIAYRESAFRPDQLLPPGKTGSDMVKPFVGAHAHGDMAGAGGEGDGDSSIGVPVTTVAATASETIGIPVARTSTGDIIALKRAAIHMAGKVMTREQEEVHNRLFGVPSFAEAVNILRQSLDTELAPLDDQRLIEELRLLIPAIQRFIDKATAVANKQV